MRVPVIFLFFCFTAASQITCPQKQDFNCVEKADNCYDGQECSTLYGGGSEIISLLNNYANEQIDSSLYFLLMSTHMGSYKKSREGLEKIYRELSNEAWKDAIDIMEHITFRGARVHVQSYNMSKHVQPKKPAPKKNSKPEKNQSESKNSSKKQGLPIPEKNQTESENNQELPKSLISQHPVFLNEIKSLAKAVDIKIKLSERAQELYNKANPCDPEVGSFLKKKFLHRDAEMVRKLVGLTNDLKHLLDTPKPRSSFVGLQNYIMDQYIKSIF